MPSERLRGGTGAQADWSSRGSLPTVQRWAREGPCRASESVGRLRWWPRWCDRVAAGADVWPVIEARGWRMSGCIMHPRPPPSGVMRLATA